MYQPTRRLISSTNTSAASARRSLRLRRLAATGAFALLSLATYRATPAQAQETQNQLCYAIAGNNPPGQAGGGSNLQDTLASIDLDTSAVASIADIARPDGTPVRDIEALSSRPDFDFLIAANANELGRVDPTTGVFTSLGFIEGFVDFDAIVIDRNGNQDRLLAVSKRSGNPQNEVVEVILSLDENQIATGIASQTTLSTVSNFPAGTNSIDGVAISPAGNVLAIANGGPNTAQRLVGLDINSGVLDDRGPFPTATGDEIPDVEDLTFDLQGRLLATTGSSFNQATTETAFVYTDPGTGALSNATTEIDLASSGAIDFEASACLRAPDDPTGDLLLVKRITAVTSNGQETRFENFVNQPGTDVDDQMLSETDGAFPLGIVEAPNSLQTGDQVEYTIYLFNPSEEITFNNVILCDPIRRPSVLQQDSIQFSTPSDNLTLDFNDTDGFERAPLAVADDACVAALDGGTQFLAGPPGPTGPNGTGGGVVTDSFDIGPGEISATRFTIEVGAVQNGETLGDSDI